MSEERQRIDKWLWHARVVRTRTAAAGLAAAGFVRVNGSRIEAASRAVRAGDVITIALDRTVRILKVTGIAPRRGSAESARGLYVDLADRPESADMAERDRDRGQQRFLIDPPGTKCEIYENRAI